MRTTTSDCLFKLSTGVEHTAKSHHTFTVALADDVEVPEEFVYPAGNPGLCRRRSVSWLLEIMFNICFMITVFHSRWCRFFPLSALPDEDIWGIFAER